MGATDPTRRRSDAPGGSTRHGVPTEGRRGPVPRGEPDRRGACAGGAPARRPALETLQKVRDDLEGGNNVPAFKIPAGSNDLLRVEPR
nr:hypothetical protein [Frankia sp. ArI3]